MARARAVEILLQSSKQHFLRSQDCQSLVKDLEVAKFLKFFEKVRQRHLKYWLITGKKNEVKLQH